MKITIAITAASGSIYAEKLLERLDKNPKVEKIHLIISENALGVIQHETTTKWIDSLSKKVVKLNNTDLYTPIASGSNCDDAMIIVPCSAGTLGRIASGISDTLITRSADVILKERRKLILALRETPLSLIHIENMRTVTLAGGIIIPTIPSFYNNPKTIDDVLLTVVQRIEKQINITADHFKWKE